MGTKGMTVSVGKRDTWKRTRNSNPGSQSIMSRTHPERESYRSVLIYSYGNHGHKIDYCIH